MVILSPRLGDAHVKFTRTIHTRANQAYRSWRSTCSSGVHHHQEQHAVDKQLAEWQSPKPSQRLYQTLSVQPNLLVSSKLTHSPSQTISPLPLLFQINYPHPLPSPRNPRTNVPSPPPSSLPRQLRPSAHPAQPVPVRRILPAVEMRGISLPHPPSTPASHPSS